MPSWVLPAFAATLIVGSLALSTALWCLVHIDDDTRHCPDDLDTAELERPYR